MMANILAAQYAENQAAAAQAAANAQAQAQAQAQADAQAEANTYSAESSPPPAPQPEVSEAVKDQIKKEVTAEIKAREDQDSVPLNKTLSTNYVHIVSEEIDSQIIGTNDTCLLTSGDLIKVDHTPKATDQTAEMVVVTSKNKDCKPNTHVLISLPDLQNMNNSFSESVDKGLEKLQQDQGKDGLPAAPSDALTPPTATMPDQDPAKAAQDAKDAAKELDAQPTE
jgi:methionine aminopeptidase